jgi:membrane protease YdiL (CAAX protease family)
LTPVEPGSPRPASAPDPRGPSIFTLEGRAAPGLYFVGWIASIAGLATLLVALQAGGGTSALALSLAGAFVLAVGLVAAAGSQAIERRRRRGSYVGPSPFLAFAASLPLTLLVLAPTLLIGLDPTSPVATLISVTISGIVYFLLVRLLVVDTGALSWREMGWRRPDTGVAREILSGALLAFPVTILVAVLAAVLVQLIGAAPDSVVQPSPTAAGFAVNLLAAIVVAPVSEEFFFRGFATTAWLRRVGVESAIVRGALFFAAAHILTVGGDTFALGAERALFAFIARLPVALALGWVFVRSRSLYASIGLHALFNGLPFLAYLLVGRG